MFLRNHAQENVIWVGIQEMCVNLEAKSEKVVCFDVLLPNSGQCNFICQLEDHQVKSVETIISKSKYEAPTIILGSVEKQYWCKV